MDELYNIGIEKQTIKYMLDINANIKEMTNEEIIAKEKILEHVGCIEEDIINIIGSNPLYLNEANDKTINLLNYLYKIGFKNLNLLITANPYILNLEIFEIKNYLEKEQQNGKSIEDIIDELDSNPYLFSEM